MAKLDEKTQLARRERVLNAAEQCFARQGFHRTSMQDICREAGISAGALYVYFESKEALIRGICEREMHELTARLNAVKASPDFMRGLAALGEAYTVHQPLEKLRLHTEINAEALRNPAVAEIVREIDGFVLQSFERLLEAARDAGQIEPTAEIPAIARVLNTIGDGMCWQRTLNPDLDTATILPLLFVMITPLLNPVAGEAAPESVPSENKARTGMKSKSATIRRTLGAAVLAVMALSGASANYSVAAAETTNPQADSPAVSVALVRSTAFVETIHVTGSLTARREVLVSPQIEGLRILEVLAEEGDRVKAGQILARLDRSTLDAQLAQLNATAARADAAIAQAKSRIVETEATLKQTEAAFERAKDLVKNGTTSRATYDDREAAARTAAAALASAKDGLVLAQADRKQVEAQISELQLKLGYTEIKAPSAGVISRRTVNVGAVASGSSVAAPLFRIVEDGQLELDAEVPETYLPRLSAGLAARVEVAGLKLRKGTIRLIAPEVDRSTRLGKVRIFLGDDPELRVGTFAKGQIDTASRDGLGVPSTAVMHSEKGAAVQVVEAGHVVTRTVTVGMTVSGRTEILEGLKDGETVVLRSGTLLREGDAVRPITVDKVVTSGVK
jgi:HlyD family secretion protein